MAVTIQDFYKLQLNSLQFTVSDDDLISFVGPDGKAIPATVDKRRLVLPTKAQLRAGFDEELQPFHPLSENIARRSASPVMQGLQRTAKAVLAHYFTELMKALLEVAADTGLHKDLPPACSGYLKQVPDADAKMPKVFEQLISRAVKKNQLITLYLKNGGTLDGKKLNRLCVVHFPFMEELLADQPFGLKIRKKDRDTLLALSHHVMPFGDSPEEYSAGSNSRIAPFYDSFLNAYAKTAGQLNTILRKYGKALEIPLTEIPLDYMDHIGDLGKLYDKVPSLRGNDGGTKEEVEATTPVTSPTEKPVSKVSPKPANPTPPWETAVTEAEAHAVPHAPPTMTPQRTKSAIQSPGSGVSVSDFMKSMNTQPTPPPYGNPGPGGYPQQPAQQYQQPYMQQPNTPPGPVQSYYGTPQYSGYGQPAQPNYGGYAQPDPRKPAWLPGHAGGAPAQPPQSPFAAAMQMNNGGGRHPTSNHGGGYGPL